jgi:uncharacterized protein
MAGNIRAGHWPWIVSAGLALLLLAAAPVVHAAGPLTIQDPGTYVVDTAHVLGDDARQSLENLLGELDQATTAQVKLLTVPSLDGEDIFSFAQRHYTLWKLGRKDKNNGALIVLSVADRKVRIHTGYGLEGVLPDSWIGSLSREVAEEYFKQGKYSDGLYHLTAAVVNQIADDAGVKIAGAPNVRHVAPQNQNGTSIAILLIFILIIVVFSLLRNRLGWNLWGPIIWSGNSGGFGGFGGGFGGSSGGFGGGSFGGGGSSGGGGGGASW